MSEFQLSQEVNPEKCFIVNSRDINKRLDPFYYIPSLMELEKEVALLNPQPLRKYVLSIASGATPKKSEAKKYYATEENGIPFLRVQNLSPSGKIELHNCKYINEETHNGYLKRSQVEGGDLLVKITGVGRMAVASVAPDGFIGNTNQHMVVIKTKDKETSEIIASYLNTDIGEKLASRRATGGTRPALDYPALLSIPIIFDSKILNIHKNSIEIKQQKEAEAEALLENIDNYLLSELGIELPEYDDSLESRMFTVGLNEIANKRFDPDYYSTSYTVLNQSIKSSCFNTNAIASVVSLIKGGKTPAKSDYIEIETEFPLIKAGSYTKDFINLNKLGYTKEFNGNEVEKNDIFILSAAHQSQYVGRQIKFLNKEPKVNTSYVGELICIRAIPEYCNPMYLFSLLNLEIYKSLLNREKTGQTSHIYGKDIKNIKIPLPPIEKQNEIAQHIQSMRDQAKQLQEEAKEVLDGAKREVEAMILGE